MTTTIIIIIIVYTVSINACIVDGSFFFSFVGFILSKGRAREKSHPFPSNPVFLLLVIHVGVT